jgi:hypothetical protein
MTAEIPPVLTEVKAGVMVTTLNRPEVRNAVNLHWCGRAADGPSEYNRCDENRSSLDRAAPDPGEQGSQIPRLRLAEIG